MGDMQRPDWWSYPLECGRGTSVGGGPGVRELACSCAGGDGHLQVRCLSPGCSSVWYKPPHIPGPRLQATAAGRRDARPPLTAGRPRPGPALSRQRDHPYDPGAEGRLADAPHRGARADRRSAAERCSARSTRPRPNLELISRKLPICTNYTKYLLLDELYSYDAKAI